MQSPAVWAVRRERDSNPLVFRAVSERPASASLARQINAGSGSWLANLQTTTKFQDAAAPLSVPGCWAYPDML